MRLNKIKNLFVVLTLGLSTHSCLDLEPQEQLAETNYLPINSMAGHVTFQEQWNISRQNRYILIILQICLPIKMNVIYLAMEAMLYSLPAHTCHST